MCQESGLLFRVFGVASFKTINELETNNHRGFLKFRVLGGFSKR